MGKIYDQLCEINKEWDSGKFNILKGLKILGEAVRGSDLLPGEISMETLESLATAMYKNKQTFEEDVSALRLDNLQRNNSMLMSQRSLSFVAPKASSIMDAGHIFSNLVELKQTHGQREESDTPLFIETLTASERMHTQLVLDQSTMIDGKIYQRTACCKGRPGDGYIGCVLYQIDELINGTLGVYLSKGEYENFKKEGMMPVGSESRVCILCYSQMMTCQSALFGPNGVGCNQSRDETMFFQDLVNCNNGYQSKYMILAGGDGIFPPAPFLSFHPRQLRISLRGQQMYVDESSMWFRPDQAGFQ